MQCGPCHQRVPTPVLSGRAGFCLSAGTAVKLRSNPLTRSFGIGLTLFLLTLASWRGANAAEVLTNAAQVRALSYDEALTRQPACLRGLVTGEGSTGI